MNYRTLKALAATVVLIAPVFAEEKKIPNLGYTTWSKFEPGTKVTMKTTYRGIKFEHTMTSELVKVTGDKLVMRLDSVTNAFGQATKEPAVNQDIPKEIKTTELRPRPIIEGIPPLDPKTGLPEGAEADGKEKLKIGDVEYECERFKYTNKIKLQGGGEATATGQVWMSDMVPGQMVRMTTKLKGLLLPAEITMEVISVAIKE